MQFFEPLIPGNYYHIYNRGINSENLFKQPKNYGYFLQLYQHHVTPFVETYAFNLLGNHFHLMIFIKEKIWINEEWVDNSDGKTSKAFSNFFNAYAQGMNKVYKRTGGLFETPFKRKLIASQAIILGLFFIYILMLNCTAWLQILNCGRPAVIILIYMMGLVWFAGINYWIGLVEGQLLFNIMNK